MPLLHYPISMYYRKLNAFESKSNPLTRMPWAIWNSMEATQYRNSGYAGGKLSYSRDQGILILQ